MATGRYCSLFSLIYFVFTSASSSLMATSLAWVLVLFSTSINSVSSSKLPFDSVSLCSKSLSNFWRAFLFALTSFNSAFKLSSRAFCSCDMTLPSNCCYRPPCVTVKSMTVVLALSSGENDGLGRRHVRNILKFLSKSISWPAILMIPLDFFQMICFSSTGSTIGST